MVSLQTRPRSSTVEDMSFGMVLKATVMEQLRGRKFIGLADVNQARLASALSLEHWFRGLDVPTIAQLFDAADALKRAADLGRWAA